MSSFHHTLGQLEIELGRLHLPAADRLRTALPYEQWESLATSLPFKVPSELEQLYRWRDGVAAHTGDLLTDLQVFPGFYLLPMQEAVRIYHERENAPQWESGWFAFAADGAGDFYILPCNVPQPANVIGFIHGEPEQVVEYLSIHAMTQTLVTAYQQGAIFIDPLGDLEFDDDAYQLIARKHNPGIDVWRD